MSASLTCPACQSTRLSPTTELGNISPIALYFQEKQEKKRWLGRLPEEASIDRARLCLDCGFTLFFCSPKHLAKLQAMEARLESRGL